MDRLPSTEFRRTYARIEKPVQVTVNGHVIGTYWPERPGIEIGVVAVHPTPPAIKSTPS